MEIFPRILFKPKVYRLWCSGSRCYEVSYVGNIKLKKTNGRVTEIDITYAHSTENTAQLMEWLDNRRILAQVPAMLTHFSVCSPPRPALSPTSHIFNCTGGSYVKEAARGLKLTYCLHHLSSLWLSGSMPALPTRLHEVQRDYITLQCNYMLLGKEDLGQTIKFYRYVDISL